MTKRGRRMQTFSGAIECVDHFSSIFINVNMSSLELCRAQETQQTFKSRNLFERETPVNVTEKMSCSDRWCNDVRLYIWRNLCLWILGKWMEVEKWCGTRLAISDDSIRWKALHVRFSTLSFVWLKGFWYGENNISYYPSWICYFI